MKVARKTKTPASAESIARIADRGEDVSRFFTNRGTMMQPIQRVNVDFTAAMLEGLDQAASELNVSRQAVIKTFLRQALDHRYRARRARWEDLSVTAAGQDRCQRHSERKVR